MFGLERNPNWFLTRNISNCKRFILKKILNYSFKHIGSKTISKSQGETLPLGIAIEINLEYSPWEKGYFFLLN